MPAEPFRQPSIVSFAFAFLLDVVVVWLFVVVVELVSGVCEVLLGVWL